MLESEAIEIKKQFCHFNSSVENDFNEIDGFYVRVHSHKDYSQYLIKGYAHRPYVVAVGLGENSIGFKTLTFSLAQLRAHLRKTK